MAKSALPFSLMFELSGGITIHLVLRNFYLRNLIETYLTILIYQFKRGTKKIIYLIVFYWF